MTTPARGSRADRTARHRHSHRASAFAAAGATLLLAAASSLAGDRPSALLYGASMQTALDFAVASAQERGWVVAAIGPQGAAFEQWLEESAEGEVLESIRVYADLVEESGGIRVSLRADRIEAPGTDREWLWDVTGAYADNLTNALASLRARWDLHRADSGSAPNGIASADPARERWSTPPPGAVGTWAYYAEAHAARLGCELTDRGAVLVAAGDGWEDHRVPCLDGSERRILCRHGECTAARRR